jgi:hypothetical protein
MTDQGDGAWFRAKPRILGPGYNYAPVTWQGWLVTLGLAPAIVATVFAGDPKVTRHSNIAGFLKIKSMLGLGGAHLPPATVAVLVFGEVALFVLLLLWKSRTLRPLD